MQSCEGDLNRILTRKGRSVGYMVLVVFHFLDGDSFVRKRSFWTTDQDGQVSLACSSCLHPELSWRTLLKVSSFHSWAVSTTSLCVHTGSHVDRKRAVWNWLSSPLDINVVWTHFRGNIRTGVGPIFLFLN